MARTRTRIWLAAGMVWMAATCSGGHVLASDVVRISRSTDSFSFAQFLAADAGGFFAEEGLRVEHIRTPAASTAVGAVLGTNVDMYVGSTSAVLRAKARGADLVVVAALTTQFVTDIVVSRKWAKAKGITPETPLTQRLQGLRGATIGISGPSGGSDQIARYAARYAGLDPDRDLTLTAIGIQASTMLAALQRERIDGFSISAPTSLEAVQNYDAMFLVQPSAGELKPLDGFLYIVAAVDPALLKSNPGLVERSVRAFQRALNASNDPVRTERLRDAVRDKFYPRIDKGVFAAAWRDNAPAVPRTVETRHEQYLQVIEFENQFAKDRLGPEVGDGLFTNAVAGQAVVAFPPAPIAGTKP